MTESLPSNLEFKPGEIVCFYPPPYLADDVSNYSLEVIANLGLNTGDLLEIIDADRRGGWPHVKSVGNTHYRGSNVPRSHLLKRAYQLCLK